MSGNKMMVLIVEDNPGDAFLVERMLKDSQAELERDGDRGWKAGGQRDDGRKGTNPRPRNT